MASPSQDSENTNNSSFDLEACGDMDLSLGNGNSASTQRRSGDTKENGSGKSSTPVSPRISEVSAQTSRFGRRASYPDASKRANGSFAGGLGSYPSIRQWDIASISSISSSTTEQQGEWICEQCTYRNADSGSRICALCGWDHSLAGTDDRSSISETWPPLPPALAATMSSTSSQSLDSRNDKDFRNESFLPQPYLSENIPSPSVSSRKLSRPDSFSNASSSFDVNSGDSTASTIKASNLRSAHQLVNNSSDLEAIGLRNSVRSLGGQRKGGPDASSLNGIYPPLATATEATDNSDTSMSNGENNVAAIRGTQNRGVIPKYHCQHCSSRVALVCLLLLIIFAGVATVLAVLLRDSFLNEQSVSEGTTTTSPSLSPTPTTVAPDLSSPAPIETTNPPTQPPTSGETPSRAPAVPTTVSPTAYWPTISPTQGSVSLVQLGEGIKAEGYGGSFGRFISLSHDGMTVAISAHNAKMGDQEESGVVRVYKYLEEIGVHAKWEQLGETLSGNTTGQDRPRFGRGLSLSSDGLTVAARANNRYVVIYRYENSSWIKRGSAIRGSTISLSDNGTIVAVGANNRTSVYEFNETTDGWVKPGPDTDIVDGIPGYGAWTSSLSGSGMSLAVGSPGPSPGKVQVYDYKKKMWQPRGEPPVFYWNHDYDDIVTAPSVALSDDGKVVAVRAESDEEKSCVKVFWYNTTSSSWMHLGEPINGTCTVGFPTVTLSSNGQILAMNGENSLNVLRFDSSANTWNVLVEESDKAFTASMSRNGEVVAVKDGRKVKIFNISSV